MRKTSRPIDAIKLIRLSEEHTIAFKEEMQEAFQHGFMAYYKDDNQWQVLPDKDFYQSLEAEGAEAYEAVREDGQRVGGAIITANGNMGELAFLLCEGGCSEQRNRPSHLESHRDHASRDRGMGNLHPILRPPQYSLLHQPLRIPCC